jgi:hypothetical protein
MPQGIRGWAIWGAAQVLLTLALKIIIKLADNAMMGWGDDRLAELFGITSPSASTVFNWAVPFILAAVALWLFHHFTTRPLREALAQQSGGDRFSAIGVVYGPSRRTWIQKVEPYHIIILGLLIAVGGVAWMFARASQSAKNSATDRAAIIIAPFQAQIDSLNRQIARLRSQTPPSQREFTTRTIRELRAFYEGRTRLQADAFMADEKGKLIDVEGTVNNVDSGMAFLQAANPQAGNNDFVECRFDNQWNAKLSTFRQGDHMKIRGTIGPSQNGAQIYLQECEIIS